MLPKLERRARLVCQVILNARATDSNPNGNFHLRRGAPNSQPLGTKSRIMTKTFRDFGSAAPGKAKAHALSALLGPLTVSKLTEI